MRTLLLLAKSYALKQEAPELDLCHLWQALAHFEIDEAALERFNLRQHIDTSAPTEDVNGLLQVAESAAPIPIARRVQSMIRRLEESNPPRLKDAPTHARSVGFSKARRIHDQLNQMVAGQGPAIGSIVQYLVNVEDRLPVRGAFAFIGPNGCGKSLTARVLADATESQLFVFDCARIDSAIERSVLDGAAGFIMGSAPGELTQFVRMNPRSVIVLQNFDLMHPAAQNVVLPILADGVLKDQYGFYENDDARSKRLIAPSEVSFKDTFLILEMSTAGADFYDAPALLSRLEKEGGEPRVLDALMASLRTARNEFAHHGPGLALNSQVLTLMASRGCLALFRRLDSKSLVAICRNSIDVAAKDFGARMGCTVQVSDLDTVSLLLVLAQGGHINGRSVATDAIARVLFSPITEYWLKNDNAQNLICISLPDRTQKALCKLVKLLGDDPTRSLFIQQRRISYEVKLRPEEGVLVSEIVGVKLVKDAHAADFRTSDGGILVEVPDIRFADVAGQDIVKAALNRQVALLKAQNAKLIRAAGGMLLYGPPGTGKTTLARAFAAECNLPFIPVTGAQLLDLGFQRELMARVQRYAPCILFIDEIDGLGSRRHGPNPALSDFLAALDGVQSRSGEPVFVIATTNAPKSLDPALLRPGRLELQYELGNLDRTAREDLLGTVLDRIDPTALPAILDYSCGMSGAQMAAAIREIHLTNQPRLNAHDVRACLDLVVFGEAQHLPEKIRKSIAYHEAGHVVASLTSGDVKVEYVSLTARERSAGHVYGSQLSASPLTLKQARGQLTTLMAGRAAQLIRFGPEDGMDSGDQSDLESATHLAYRCIAHLGFDQIIGPVRIPDQDDGFKLPDFDGKVCERLKVWIDQATTAADEILRDHWPLVTTIAERLLEVGALAHAELMTLANEHGLAMGGDHAE